MQLHVNVFTCYCESVTHVLRIHVVCTIKAMLWFGIVFVCML